MENAFVFSSDKALLQTVIGSYRSGSTFIKTDAFVSAKEALADESSILYMGNPKHIGTLLDSDDTKNLHQDFREIGFDDRTFAAQIVADEDFSHINLITGRIGRKSKINTATPLFNVQLDGKLATSPQFVTNHRTNKKEIVVQDQENNLYLISTEGKVLWKKQLDGQIQGRIHQVDIYKNRKLQLAFTTNNQFLILDRNGKEVSPFQKSLTVAI